MSSSQTKLFAILAVTILLAVSAFAGILLLQTPQDGDDEPLVLVSGSSGTSINVTLTEMTQLTTITRNGSYQNSFGNVRGVGIYTGILISDLVELVGGMTEDNLVMVIASDGYNQTFEYSKVYPNTAIWDIQGDMILAYEFNGTTVPEFEKGFKLMFLPEDGYYSNADANETTDPDPYAAGPQLVSNVAEIRVIREPIALVVDVDGTVEGYPLDDITEMTSISGEGGYRRNSGTISGPWNFTGVSVLSLLEQVATLPDNYTLIAYSSDGWSSQYTKAVVEGTVNGYTPVGDPLDEIHSEMVLAYEMDGSPVGEEDGPLRIVFLNEDGNLTDGSRWAKQVVNLTLTEVPLSSMVLEESNVEIIRDSLIEIQICGQSKLFTYTFVRWF
ncbi:MAG: hypothetical protein ACXACG_06080 [Candidatus Thorarchaeota archaeon]|jgi:DMSO/TMAO reductase YedYZ molybdopterin-dependent catalytic subunit